MIELEAKSLSVVNKDPLYWKAYISLMERAVDYREKYSPRERFSVQSLVAINKLSDDNFDTLWGASK